MVTSFDIEEHPLPEGQRAAAPVRIIATDYFKTMGIPVRQGRVFDENDRFDSAPVVIVNERFANKFFPGPERHRETDQARLLAPTTVGRKCARSSASSGT